MAKKQDLPAMPFYVGDWLKCPEVKVLPPDLRGLWFDMICYMWESVERGVMVKPNNQPYTKQEIVRMIGLDSSGTASWLDQLIDNGVCSVRSDGAIFSRRMVRDEDIRQKRRSAGKKGGDVTKAKYLKKEEPSTAPSEPLPTPPPPLTPKEKAKVEKAKKHKYADYVTLTKDEYMKLVEAHTKVGADRMVQILNNYKGSSGKKYKSDYMTILNWVVGRYNEEIQSNGHQSTQTIPGNPGSAKGESYRSTL